MLAFIFGLVIGSFLNVLICRIPAGKSVVFPSSHCPVCEHKLSAIDLFPVLSYLLLRGKCRYCGVKISIRYPLIELLTGLAFALSYYYFGWSLSFFKIVSLIVLLIPITFIDLDTMTIPDQLSLGGAVVGLVFSIIDNTWLDSLLGGITGAGIIYAIYLLGLLIYKQETIGGGDVKLMLMIGLFLGVKMALLTVFLAMFTGSVIGVALILAKLKTRKDYIPFGPFIAIGCLMAVFLHNELVSIYSVLVLR